MLPNRSWDHHDLISVEPIYNTSASHPISSSSHCSTGAIISSIAPYSGQRRSTAVMATDEVTGMLRRCEVRIDRISKIVIGHRSLDISLEEIETLQVLAFDDNSEFFMVALTEWRAVILVRPLTMLRGWRSYKCWHSMKIVIFSNW